MVSQLIGIARLASSAPTLEQKRLTEYRQLPAYTLLNRCSEIGCKYCYARYTHEFLELRDPVDFETKIFTKAWNQADFRAQMRKFNPRDRVAIGTATDPYQPAASSASPPSPA